jgi:hypothetical protein
MCSKLTVSFQTEYKFLVLGFKISLIQHGTQMGYDCDEVFMISYLRKS